MNETLELYLHEIDSYLAVSADKKEILTEIESHILEKTREEHGAINDDTIKKTIAAYGSAREVAEKYMEDSHIIAPAFRNHLFRYTWLVFAVHAGLSTLMFLLDSELTMFPPLFAVPRMENFFNFLNQLPMVWVYDFGLVALFLFFLTQSKKRVDLPWPVLRTRKKKRAAHRGRYAPPRPHVGLLAFMTALFVGALYLFLHHGTVFFKSLNFDDPEPLLTGPASVVYSLLVIVWIGLEIVFHTMRFLSNTFTLELVKNLFFLIFLWGLMNVSIEGELVDISWLHFPVALEKFKTGLIVLIALIIFIETLEIVYKMVRNHQLSDHQAVGGKGM
jgi:hypothetical protein